MESRVIVARLGSKCEPKDEAYASRRWHRGLQEMRLKWTVVLRGARSQMLQRRRHAGGIAAGREEVEREDAMMQDGCRGLTRAEE
jgi:hypothetical protein